MEKILIRLLHTLIDSILMIESLRDAYKKLDHLINQHWYFTILLQYINNLVWSWCVCLNNELCFCLYKGRQKHSNYGTNTNVVSKKKRNCVVIWSWGGNSVTYIFPVSTFNESRQFFVELLLKFLWCTSVQDVATTDER